MTVNSTSSDDDAAPTCGLLSPTEFNVLNLVVLTLISAFILWKIHRGYQRKRQESDALNVYRTPQKLSSDTLVFPIYFTFLKVARLVYSRAVCGCIGRHSIDRH